MNKRFFFLLLIIFLLPACVQAPLTAPVTDTPQSASDSSGTSTPIPTLTNTLSPTQTPIPTSPPDFCADIRGTNLILSLSKAFAENDGVLFASLVSPSHGVDVMFYRNGNPINYDVEHAQFVFETTFDANWGISFGSGETTIGSFQEIVLPSLKQVFTPNSLIICSQLQVGGATYIPEWPYLSMNYYSVFFPGTEEFSGLDWETWAVGMELIEGRPYLAALVHYVWEP